MHSGTSVVKLLHFYCYKGLSKHTPEVILVFSYVNIEKKESVTMSERFCGPYVKNEHASGQF